MKTRVHLCVSVSGALMHWNKKLWASVGADNGMTAAQMKKQFELYQHDGKKVIPMGEECEGFSYVTGCPGHPIEDEK